jgi:poly-D-alanine transfer protein DltD
MKNTVKTTVEIDKKLLYDVKKKLLEDNMTMKDAIHASLQGYLYSEKNIQNTFLAYEDKQQKKIIVSPAIQKTFGAIKPLKKRLTDNEIKEIIKEERAQRDRDIIDSQSS